MWGQIQKVQHHGHSLHRWLQVPTLQGLIYSGKSIFHAPTQLSASLVPSSVHGTACTKFPLFGLGPEQAALGFSAPKGQKMCTCTSPEQRAARSSPASAPRTGCEAKPASKTQASALQESICLQARCPFFQAYLQAVAQRRTSIMCSLAGKQGIGEGGRLRDGLAAAVPGAQVGAGLGTAGGGHPLGLSLPCPLSCPTLSPGCQQSRPRISDRL